MQTPFKSKSRTSVALGSFYGLTETAWLPCTRSGFTVLTGPIQTHYATLAGKILLSVDNMDRSINYCDPSVYVSHQLDGMTQWFRGNYISLKPISVEG
jgi:hypothetical protein